MPQRPLPITPFVRLVLAISLDGRLAPPVEVLPSWGVRVTVVLWSRHWHGPMPA